MAKNFELVKNKSLNYLIVKLSKGGSPRPNTPPIPSHGTLLGWVSVPAGLSCQYHNEIRQAIEVSHENSFPSTYPGSHRFTFDDFEAG
jgi:hypothetical protein